MWPEKGGQANLGDGVDDAKAKLGELPDTLALAGQAGEDDAVACADEGAGIEVLLEGLKDGDEEGGDRYDEGSDGRGGGSVHSEDSVWSRDVEPLLVVDAGSSRDSCVEHVGRVRAMIVAARSDVKWERSAEAEGGSSQTKRRSCG